MSLLEIALKLLLAVALGGIVGLERESSHKPAGFRTNVLICVGATMMMILSVLILHEQKADGDSLSRIAAGVITGIGFIGAGTIIQARGSVLGLTTAATLWAVAGLGLVIGAGYYWIAIVFASLILLTLIIFGYVERQYFKKAPYRYRIKTQQTKDILANIKKLASHEGLKFQQLTIKKEEDFSIIDLSFQATEEKEQKYNQSLFDLADVLEIKIE
ncbi:MAG: MgtC/SapB family protein [Candidatus Aminicenantes bacterium]|nr:MgtC/SapB family protein [Candidatus Aminicenantes bacterium]